MLSKRGLLDPIQSLKQPISHIAHDVIHWARHTAERRRHLTSGDVERALHAEAKLVREVQFARESMGTYARIEGLMAKHGPSLSGLAPDDQTPERMVMFVGQSRSGHSLVGSLIDAHPEAVVAHEIHALKHLLQGRSFAEVVRAIVEIMTGQDQPRLGKTGEDLVEARAVRRGQLQVDVAR